MQQYGKKEENRVNSIIKLTSNESLGINICLILSFQKNVFPPLKYSICFQRSIFTILVKIWSSYVRMFQQKLWTELINMVFLFAEIMQEKF